MVLEGPNGHTHGGHGARLHGGRDGRYDMGQPVLALMTVEISTTHLFSLLLASSRPSTDSVLFCPNQTRAHVQQGEGETRKGGSAG